MSARAPQAIWNLWYDVHRQIPTSQLGGIVGDVNHSFGYHLARRDLPGSDYSVQLPADKLGKNDCASAIDVSLSPELMIFCTKRLIAAAQARDPRLVRVVREFCGTTNGTSPHPYDVHRNFNDPNNTEGWDSSHVWHIHISFYREFADNEAALLPVADVLAGVPLKAAPTDPNWSDMATQAEIQKMIDDTVVEGLRASLLGEQSGEFTNAKHPRIVPADTAHGALERIGALEAKVKP